MLMVSCRSFLYPGGSGLQKVAHAAIISIIAATLQTSVCVCVCVCVWVCVYIIYVSFCVELSGYSLDDGHHSVFPSENVLVKVRGGFVSVSIPFKKIDGMTIVVNSITDALFIFIFYT